MTARPVPAEQEPDVSGDPRAAQPTSDHIDAACEAMHDAYERAAVGAGWETNPASRKPWRDVPEANKNTMRAAVSALLDDPAAVAAIANEWAARHPTALLDALTNAGVLTEDWDWACCGSQFEHVSIKGRHKAEYRRRLATEWTEEQPE